MNQRSIVFTIFFLLSLTTAPFARAMDQIELEGEGRIVNVYKAREIPEYLRTSHCSKYAYKQTFGTVIVDRQVLDGTDYAVGAIPSDTEILKSKGICLLILKKEFMLQGKKIPVTFYEIETFKGGKNEIRVGQNHREMRDGRYKLENGTVFTVRDNVLIDEKK